MRILTFSPSVYLTLCDPMDYITLQAPLSLEFSRQDHWCRLPFPTSGDLPDPRIKPEPLAVPALAGGFFTTLPHRKRVCVCVSVFVHTLTCVIIWMCLINMLSVRSHMQKKKFRLSDLMKLYEIVEKYASLYRDRKDISGFLEQRWEIKGRKEGGGMWQNFSGDAAAAKLLQSCPTLCGPIDGSPPGSPIPGLLQARTLEWVAISFSNAWKWKVKVKLLSRVRLSNAWKWKVKVKLLSRVRLLATSCISAYQTPPSMGFSRQEYWSGVPFPSPFQGIKHALSWLKW